MTAKVRLKLWLKQFLESLVMARFVRLYSLARLYFLDSPGQNQIPNQWSDFVSPSYAPNG